MYKFGEKDIIHKLEILEDEALDRLDFGVIGFDQSTFICRYNRKEGEMSGYQRKHLLGKPLFLEVAPCMNNYRVALKFEEQEELDEVLPYIFSFKMKPVRVQLRLLKNPLSVYSYVLVQN